MDNFKKVFSNRVVTSISWPLQDAVKVMGTDGPTLIENCVFDFRNIKPEEQDEILSGVNGAKVCVRNCLFLGGIKAILAGNGDYPEEDRKDGEWELYNCVFLESCRRQPEAQDGVKVKMENCWIHNWGVGQFDVRSFGAWAHKDAEIYASYCLFTRDSHFLSPKHMVLDIANHVGQTVNDEGWTALFKPRTWLPGTCRGLVQTDTGKVTAHNCYRNHNYIRIDNNDDFLDKEDALGVIRAIEKEWAKSPALDTQRFLGKSLSECFIALT